MSFIHCTMLWKHPSLSSALMEISDEEYLELVPILLTTPNNVCLHLWCSSGAPSESHMTSGF
jgi:hypothetical protein